MIRRVLLRVALWAMIGMPLAVVLLGLAENSAPAWGYLPAICITIGGALSIFNQITKG